MLDTAQSMPQGMGMIRQMMNMVKSAGNPQQMMTQLASQNPQMKQIIDMVGTSGNPKQMFLNICKQRGIDPEQIISMLK